jgi:hypothetical protein
MALTNTITGNYTLDETSGIQNGADGTPTGSPRDDSDISLAKLQTDASAFYTYLFTTKGYLTSDVIGAAESGSSIINVQDSSGGTISSIGLTDSSGGSFDGTQSSGIFTTSGHEVFLVSDSNNQVVLGKYDSDGNGSLDAVAYAVYMQPDSGGLDNNVNVQLFSVTFTALQHPVAGSDTQAYDDAVDLLQNVYVHSTGELHINFDNMPSGANLFNDAAESASGGGVIVFGMNPVVGSDGKYTNASDYISTSQGGTGATIGVNSQMFDPGEGAYFTYVTDIVDSFLSGQKGGLSPTEADYAKNMQYAGGLIDAHTASVHISQIQDANNPAGVTITAYKLNDDYQGLDLLNNRGGANGTGSKSPIDHVVIWNAAHTQMLADSSVSGVQNGITIIITAGVANVQGLSVSDIIEWHTTDVQNQVLIQNSSAAGKFDIGGFDIKEGSSDTDSLAGHSYVEDSGPAIGPISDGGGIGGTGNDAPLDYAANATVTHSLNGSAGTDGLASYEITSFATSVTLTGVTLTGADPDGTGQTIQYFQDVNHDGDYDSTGATPDVLYYTMSLTPAGSYTFTLNNAPAAPDLVFHFDNLPSGDNLFGTVAADSLSPGIIVFGEDPHLKNGKMDNISDTVATSQGGTGATIGIDNQMFDPGDGAYFTVVKNIVADFLSGAPGGLSSTEADYAKNIQYTGGLYGVQGATLGISQVQGNVPIDAKFTAYALSGDPQGSNLLFADHTGTQVDIASVLVTHADGTVDNNVTIKINADGTAEVDNLSAGDLIKVMSAGSSDLFNQVLVEDLSGKFDVGSFGISQAQVIPDQTLPFKVTITDGDSDTAVSNEFNVYIDGNHDGLIT